MYDIEEILRVNRHWRSGSFDWMRGAELSSIRPGTIDPTRAIIFGHVEPDSPFAMDQRTGNGEVVYLSNVGSEIAWVGTELTFQQFMNYTFEGPKKG